MTSEAEYDFPVKQKFPIAVYALLAIAVLFAMAAQAQINGAPSSVTSPGFGGRAVNGSPASVTSLGPRGYARSAVGVPLQHPRRRVEAQSRRHDGNHIAPLYYAVPVPYAVDDSAVNDGDAADDGDQQGGPTVFDRRGLGERSYVPPVGEVPRPHADASDGEKTDPEPVAPATVLVFNDGRKLEVQNYAIIGPTLFDLTPGHPRRLALAELNLGATRDANESQGVSFQWPGAAGRAN